MTLFQDLALTILKCRDFFIQLNVLAMFTFLSLCLIMLTIIENHQELPFYPVRAMAGFPSPADDHLENEIDLVAHLVRRPAATFVMQVTGNSMEGAGILDGDYVVVDKSVKAASGHIVVAVLDGDMTIKYYHVDSFGYFLKAAHPQYKPIELSEDNPPEIWGVVVGVVRRCV